MKEIKTHVDYNGRILIPASIRKEHHIKSGDIYVIRAIDDEIKLISLNKITRRPHEQLVKIS